MWSPQAPQPVQKVEPVKMSMATATSVNFLFSLIKDKGIDKKHYIDLSVVYSDPGESERKLAEKLEGVEIANYSPISLIETNASKNLNIQSFAPILNNSFYFLVKKDSRFQNISDLKGAKISLRPKASAAYKATAVAMKIAGFDLEKDFKLSFGSLPQSIAQLEGGDTDATVLPALDTALLLATGKYRTVYDLGKKWEEVMGSPMPFVSISAHSDWIAANPQKVQNIRAMMIEANEYINNNPQVFQEYATVIGIKTPEAAALVAQYAPALYPTKWLPLLHWSTVQKAVELKILPSLPGQSPFIN